MQLKYPLWNRTVPFSTQTHVQQILALLVYSVQTLDMYQYNNIPKWKYHISHVKSQI